MTSLELISKRLAEIEARASKATPGPWERRIQENGYGDDVVSTGHRYHNGYPSIVAGEVMHHDVQFIAHSRTDIPALVAALKAAVEFIGKLDHNPDDQDYSGCMPCDFVENIAAALGGEERK